MAVCIQHWTSHTFFLLGTWVFYNCFAVCLQATSSAQSLGGGPLLTTSCLSKPQALRFQPLLKARKLFFFPEAVFTLQLPHLYILVSPVTLIELHPE